jgi:hypothetical protein
MSSARVDPGRPAQDEQPPPYEGKHRAPEARSRGLRRSVARIVRGQPTAAPPQLPDLPGSGGPEDPGDQDPADEQE